MKWNANWIHPALDMGDTVPVFGKKFSLSETAQITGARLFLTALGVYEARLNGQRVGDYILAPGWTSYYKRLQYQEYDVTNLLTEENRLTVLVGKGWYRSPMPGFQSSPYQEELSRRPAGLLAQLVITYQDRSREIIATDETWTVSESNVRFSEIYDGEIYDATYRPL